MASPTPPAAPLPIVVVVVPPPAPLPPPAAPPPAGASSQAPATPPPKPPKPPNPALLPQSSSGENKSLEKTDEGLPKTGSNEAANFDAGAMTRTRGRGPKDEGQRKFFSNLINKVCKKKYWGRGHYYPFSTNEVVQVLRAVRKVFEGEPPMIEMKIPVVVIGDVHGQFTDLVRIFDLFRDDTKGTPGYANSRYVFLGDYVDRGKQSLEIVMLLFALKILYPTYFALLRGNHECRAINRAYGFFAEIKERFLDPKRANELFEMFNDVFTHLPLACMVGGNILCMHGGISSKMKTREDILKVPKPLKDVATNGIATDLLWADPMMGLPGEIPNKVRGVSVYFGEETLDAVMANLDLKLIIRGHQMMMNGFNLFHNKLVTVFSAAAYYPDKPNRGAICIIDNTGRVGFKCIIPMPKEHPDYKPKVFRGDHDDANDHDTGYVKVAPGVAKKKAPDSDGDEKSKAPK